MAKPTYKVWVVNQVQLDTTVYNRDNSSYYFEWNQTKLNEVVTILKSLFDEVCKHSLSKYEETVIETQDLATTATGIQPKELLIRLTTKKKSILIKKYGEEAVNADTSGGTKDTGSGIVSEAWIEGAAGDNSVPKLIARLAFHELMHNKLDASNSKNIHVKPHDGTGLAVSPVSNNTQLSDTNKKNLAPQLSAIVKQFTGTSIP
jgi:hypothetical protein